MGGSEVAATASQTHCPGSRRATYKEIPWSQRPTESSQESLVLNDKQQLHGGEVRYLGRDISGIIPFPGKKW